MSYLRLIQEKIQNLSEVVASALNVEVVIADKNLTRIVGTGDFYTRIDKDCSKDSIFAKVIKTGKPIINLSREEYCMGCTNRDDCPEFANMSYPIIINKNTIGVISFASFDFIQTSRMKTKEDEYFNMLKETSVRIEQEIINIKTANRLIKDTADVDEIINCLNKAIIILNHKDEIIHINLKALQILEVDISEHKIIGKKIKKFILGVELKDTSTNNLVDLWTICGKDTRVVYSVNKIAIEDYKYSLMISFDIMSDIVNIAKTYESKKEIQFEDIVGNSDSILKVINKSKIAASTDSTILIQGESGTGKELFARSIHNESTRAAGPFIAISCGSIPENLIESELFGYEKGAFTGASNKGKKGKVELANNGTLFLDEIGDLPIYLQTRLLRVLQERTIDKLGGEEAIDINIRIISATNKNLHELVKEGKFRLDLYYRLNVIPINIPSLINRGDDVLLCSNYIIKNLSNKMNKEVKELSHQVKELFIKYNWPGNIRELENILEHGICFSTKEHIDIQDLPDYFIKECTRKEDLLNPKDNIIHMCSDRNLEQLKNEFEESIIKALIEEYGDSLEGKKMVAEKLNIGLTTLYRKINNYTN